jgi:hypothetical protein
MTDDRTVPMQPQWSESDPDFDDQETVFTDQESVTPPTIRMGDEGRGFQRAVPSEGTTPTPFSQPPDPFALQQPTAPPDQTMLISERPTPVFAWLVVVDGPDRGTIGTVHTLRPDTTAIGRVSGNHIVLRDDTCSAQHARIRSEAQEEGEPIFVLYDMGSSNGTFVGDKESYKDDESRKYRHPLQDGDYMLVGETTLVFKKL